MPGEWQPQTEVSSPDTTWTPKTEKVKVSAHMRKKQNFAEKAAQNTAPIGGMLGGYSGGPLGAFAGGAIGEGLEISNELAPGARPANAQEAANAFTQNLERVVQAGAGQAGFEAGGRVLAGTIPGLARAGVVVGEPLMTAALRSTPEVAQVAIREGIAVSRRGLNKLMGKLGEVGRQTRILIDQATVRGNRYPVQDITKAVNEKVMPEILKQADPMQDALEARAILNRVQQAKGALVTPRQLHAMVQTSDDIAAPIFKKISKGQEPISAAESVRYQVHKALADHGRELLNAIDATWDPVAQKVTSPIMNSNARASELIKLKEVAFPAVRRAVPISARFAARGAPVAAGALAGSMLPAHDTQGRAVNALGGAAAGAVLGSPAVMSNLALLAHQPWVSTVLRQTPRAVGTGMEQ